MAFDAAPFAIGQLAQENLDHVVEKAGTRRPDADDGRTGETPTPATGNAHTGKVLKVIGGAGASAFNLHHRVPPSRERGWRPRVPSNIRDRQFTRNA